MRRKAFEKLLFLDMVIDQSQPADDPKQQDNAAPQSEEIDPSDGRDIGQDVTNPEGEQASSSKDLQTASDAELESIIQQDEDPRHDNRAENSDAKVKRVAVNPKLCANQPVQTF